MKSDVEGIELDQVIADRNVNSNGFRIEEIREELAK